MAWVHVSYKLPSDTQWSGNEWSSECGFGDGCYDAYYEYEKFGQGEDNLAYREFETASAAIVSQLVAENADDSDIRTFTVRGVTWQICLGTKFMD